MKGVTVADGRGRRVPLVRTLTIMSRGDPGRNARLVAASQGHREPPTRQEVVRAVTWGALLLPIMLVLALAPAGLAFGTSLPWWAQILAAIPLGAVPALGTLFLVRRIAGERLARDWVRAGFCASCGQDLTGLSAEADGCRVCPECGAAWRTPDDATEK